MGDDHLNRHFGVTPSGSPPNNNNAQQANSSFASTYQGSQQGSRTSPTNNNQANANYVPTYQGTHANQRGTPSSASPAHNQFPRAVPNFQHGYGPLGQANPIHPSSSQGMPLYHNGPGQMYALNGSIGTSYASTSAQNFNEGGDSGHRKRQEPNGTRVVSQPKRAKRESTEGENAQKVGDRDLQTTQPRYGAYSHMFRNPDQARARLTMQQWIPPRDPHRNTPASYNQMMPWVVQVYDAMVDTTSGFYDKLNAANRILNMKYPQEQLEATAWLIVDEAAALHRNGCCLLPFADPTYELKGTKAFIHEDRELFFKDRITAICDTFKVFKSACCEALDGAKTFKIVYGPTKIRERTRNNAISNDRRAKKARISSGGSANNDAHFRGDSEGVEQTPNVDVGASKTSALAPVIPSLGSQGLPSFAVTQHIGTGAGPSPPLKMEPPHTPRKSDPPAYLHHGFDAPAAPPNPLLSEYIGYIPDPSYYSVGQHRPGFEIQPSLLGSVMPTVEQVDLTGEDLIPAHEEANSNSWLRRRDDED